MWNFCNFWQLTVYIYIAIVTRPKNSNYSDYIKSYFLTCVSTCSVLNFESYVSLTFQFKIRVYMDLVCMFMLVVIVWFNFTYLSHRWSPVISIRWNMCSWNDIENFIMHFYDSLILQGFKIKKLSIRCLQSIHLFCQATTTVFMISFEEYILKSNFVKVFYQLMFS